MINKLPKLQDIVFIDIETVSSHKSYEDLSATMKKLWKKKALHLRNDDNLSAEELYFDRAGIYAEFGKIICIGVGFFTKGEDKKETLRVKSFANDNEEQLLLEFMDLVENKFDKKNTTLCAHNGKEFDFPYLCRRMIVNRVPLPNILNIIGRKPWEVKHLDTMEMWKFGDYKSYTSLDLLAELFGIESSKTDMDGSLVTPVYYLENGLKRIAEYCRKDIIVTAQLLLRYKGDEQLSPEQIILI